MAATIITLRNTKGSPLTNTEMDTNISLLNSYSKGHLSKTITTNVTLTDIEAENYFFNISGTLTADATITIPSILIKSWTVNNITSGGFSITVKYSTGSGITILNGTRATFYFDGTNMLSISYSNALISTDYGTVTSTMIADGTIVNGDISISAAIAYSKLNLSNTIVNSDISNTAGIAIAKLASSTISGVSLGSNLNTLTISSPLVGTSYNGSAGVTLSIPAATSTVNGYMTSTYASKLDGIAAGATANTGTVTSVTATTPITSTGGTTPAISMAAATAAVNGYMTSTYASKLDNIAASATNVTNTNQLTNGAGFITSAGSCASATTFTSTTQNSQFNSIGIGTAAAATAGDIRATANITAYYTSDERLKENISPITNALEKVNQINGVNFDWTEEEITARGGIDGYFVRKNDVGVIAQEIEQVLPEAVATRDNGYKAVRYELIVPLLIESIKELSEQNQQLLKRIEALENK